MVVAACASVAVWPPRDLGLKSTLGAIAVHRLRYRYEVRQARTAALVGTFELDSDAYRTPVNLFCPDRVDGKAAENAVVAEVVADEKLATAQRPYIEISQP